MNNEYTDKAKMADSMIEKALEQPGIADVMKIQTEWLKIDAILNDVQMKRPYYMVTSAISSNPVLQK